MRIILLSLLLSVCFARGGGGRSSFSSPSRSFSPPTRSIASPSRSSFGNSSISKSNGFTRSNFGNSSISKSQSFSNPIRTTQINVIHTTSYVNTPSYSFYHPTFYSGSGFSFWHYYFWYHMFGLHSGCNHIGGGQPIVRSCQKDLECYKEESCVSFRCQLRKW